MDVVIGDVLAWVMFVGIGVLGLASCMAATIWAYRVQRGRGSTNGMALFLASIVALVTFLGLWIVADLYWLIHKGARLIRSGTINLA